MAAEAAQAGTVVPETSPVNESQATANEQAAGEQSGVAEAPVVEPVDGSTAETQPEQATHDNPSVEVIQASPVVTTEIDASAEQDQQAALPVGDSETNLQAVVAANAETATPSNDTLTDLSHQSAADEQSDSADADSKADKEKPARPRRPRGRPPKKQGASS